MRFLKDHADTFQEEHDGWNQISPNKDIVDDVPCTMVKGLVTNLNLPIIEKLNWNVFKTLVVMKLI